MLERLIPLRPVFLLLQLVGKTPSALMNYSRASTRHTSRPCGLERRAILLTKTEGLESQIPLLSKERLGEVVNSFVGPQNQVPPMYSAKKIDGKKLYKLARKGIEVERKPHHITIYNIELLDYTFPELKIRVRCSTGTYIRTLVHDIGQKLGIGAYCEALERVNIGEYSLENATPIKDFSRDTWKASLL